MRSKQRRKLTRKALAIHYQQLSGFKFIIYNSLFSNMMFANGDSNEPLKDCQDFILDFVQSQLKMLIEKALKLAQECG